MKGSGSMKLLETIEQAFRHVNNPDAPELKRIIRSLGLTPERVAPWIEQPAHLPYGRKVLYQTPQVEVILVHLPAGSETFIHDHGASIGCAYVVEGCLTNRMYRLTRDGYANEVGTATLGAGRFLHAPQGQIHQMCNLGPDRLISFHVYAPKLSCTKSFYTYEQVLDYVI